MKKIFLGLIAFLGLSSSFCISSSATTMNKIIKENPKKSLNNIIPFIKKYPRTALIGANFVKLISSFSILGMEKSKGQYCVPIFFLGVLQESFIAQIGQVNLLRQVNISSGVLLGSLELLRKIVDSNGDEFPFKTRFLLSVVLSWASSAPMRFALDKLCGSQKSSNKTP